MDDDYYDFGYGDYPSNINYGYNYEDFSIPSSVNTFEFDFPNLGGLDLSGVFDPTDISDFFGGGLDLSGVIDPTDMGDLFGGGFDLSGVIDPTDISDYLTNTDAEAQEGGFYGNTDSAYYDPRTNTTTLYNPDGTLRDTIVHDEREYDAEKQEGGFYGNTPNATYDPKTNITTIRDNNGNVIRQIPGPPITTPPPGPGPGPGPKPPPGPGPDKTITNTIKQFYDRITGAGPNKQDALLLALLGGLMGLLGKGSAPKGPVGYQGGIPKFTAVRGKPGEGTKFIQAAGGGLMDLAQGGRAARYLRGGTDGMADKIKTDIDGKQPARLSHGEFVIPADVVSHLGNGNSDAGADVLYDMMDKVRKARTGTTKQGKQINPQKYTRV